MHVRWAIVCTVFMLAMIGVSTHADSPLYQAEWTIDQLSNSTYTIAGHTYRLKNGEYFVNTEDVKEYYGIEKSLIAAGDLNSDGIDDYLVLIQSTFGGSGIFPLAIVRFSSSGSWLDTAPFDMPDRVGINKASIRKGIISLDMVVHGKGDGACCPSVKTVWKLRLYGTKIVKFEGIEDTY
jgi:hypothetical protein